MKNCKEKTHTARASWVAEARGVVGEFSRSAEARGVFRSWLSLDTGLVIMTTCTITLPVDPTLTSVLMLSLDLTRLPPMSKAK